MPIIIMGCYNCGVLIEQSGVELCLNCGALGVELEWFGPFYAETPEHLGQLSPDEIVATLERIPDEVAEVIGGVDDRILSQKPSPEEWSIKEIIAHMFETDLAFAERVRTILAADGVPTLPRAKPPWKLHEGKGYEVYTRAQLVDRLREIRAASLALVHPLCRNGFGKGR